ncbi:hypothetical protein MHYP_G00331990 [Metynnis hypsauchen]
MTRFLRLRREAASERKSSSPLEVTGPARMNSGKKRGLGEMYGSSPNITCNSQRQPMSSSPENQYRVEKTKCTTHMATGLVHRFAPEETRTPPSCPLMRAAVSLFSGTPDQGWRMAQLGFELAYRRAFHLYLTEDSGDGESAERQWCLRRCHCSSLFKAHQDESRENSLPFWLSINRADPMM